MQNVQQQQEQQQEQQQQQQPVYEEPKRPRVQVLDPRISDRAAALATTRVVNRTLERLDREGHAIPVTHISGCVYRVGSKEVHRQQRDKPPSPDPKPDWRFA